MPKWCFIWLYGRQMLKVWYNLTCYSYFFTSLCGFLMKLTALNKWLKNIIFFCCKTCNTTFTKNIPTQKMFLLLCIFLNFISYYTISHRIFHFITSAVIIKYVGKIFMSCVNGVYSFFLLMFYHQHRRSVVIIIIILLMIIIF